MYKQLRYVDRTGTNSLKWDASDDYFGTPGLLPMWVADMDFQSPACVLEALRDYISVGAFGYYRIPDSYFGAFMRWERERFGLGVRREWIRSVPGVVPGVNWVLGAFTSPGDAVMVLTPVYYPFFDAVESHGCRLVQCPLKNEGGIYSIDYDLFERMALESSAAALIFCSPHNPVGRVWRRDETARLLELCRELGIFVISDEIHQDFTFAGNVHTPAASIAGYDDMLVTLTAPSKTFNLAACQNSLLIIPDEGLRAAYDSHVKPLHLNSCSSFGYIAAEAAYTGGAEWLDELLETIYGHYEYIRAELAKRLPRAVVSPLEGTYLLWIDLSGCVADKSCVERRVKECGVAPDFGSWFGSGGYDGFIRLNLATSRENVERAVNAIAEGFAAGA